MPRTRTAMGKVLCYQVVDGPWITEFGPDHRNEAIELFYRLGRGTEFRTVIRNVRPQAQVPMQLQRKPKGVSKP